MNDLPIPRPDRPEGYTLDRALLEHGVLPPDRLPCPNCTVQTRPIEIVPVLDHERDDQLQAKWACATCLIDARRRGVARAEAKLPKLNMEDVRGMRATLLAQTDWTQLADVPPATRAKWQPYRQALRDLPANVPDPATIAWPKPPK